VDARVEWQVVPFGSQPGAGSWQPASGLPQYAFQVDTRQYGAGTFQIYVRLLENGVQTAISSVKARFSGN